MSVRAPDRLLPRGSSRGWSTWSAPCCIGLRDRTGIDRPTLSGGVFLNRFLTSACARALAADGFDVLQHHRVPASDAGIALGQVAVLAHTSIVAPPTAAQSPEQEMPCA